MKKAALLSFLFINLQCIFSQDKIDYTSWPKDDQKIFERSMGLFEEKNYIIAYEGFSKLLALHPNDYGVKYLTGVCAIYRSDKHTEAKTLLTQVIEKNKKAADIEYFFALLYHRVGEFDKCLEYAARLGNSRKLNSTQRKTLEKLIFYCNNGKKLVQTPVDVRISNIGSPPNSEFSENSPVILADESALIYTYRGKDSKGGLQNVYGKPDKFGFYYEDIFITKKTENGWTAGEPIASINTNLNDAVIAISHDGHELFLFKDDGTAGGDIYSSKLEGTTWSAPRKLKGDVNSLSWEGSVSISANGKELYFSSERPGGYGGRDLYVAYKEADGTWGNVKNMGDKINTMDDDDSPFIHPDGLTLIFSSKGHMSMGGYDIFKAEFNEVTNSWNNPVNIGFPINTTDDDLYYVLSADGKRGYYSTAKEEGHGDRDIYVVEEAISDKKTQLTMLSGSVTEDAMPVEADIVVHMIVENKNFGTFKSNLQTGKYLINLPSGFDYRVTYVHKDLGDQEYIVKAVEANSFTDQELNVNFMKGETDSLQTNPDEIFINPKDEPALTNSFKNYEPDPDAVARLRETAIAITKSENTTQSLNELAKQKPKEEIPVAVKEEIKPKEEVKPIPVETPTVAVVEKREVVKPKEEPKPVKPEPKLIASSKTLSAAAERLEMMDKYGSLKIENLKYIVQVAAYRHPENYKADKLKALAEIKKANESLGDITLLITTKEFDNWRDADTFLNQVKDAGQKDAFLTVTYNNKRLYLKDLVSQGIWASKGEVQ